MCCAQSCQSCPTLCKPMDCSLPGSSVHGISQARILEWLPFPSPKRKISSVQFSSVTQSCPSLCDTMNCSTPGLPVHHQLPEFTQTYVLPPIPSSIRVFSNESTFRMRWPKYSLSALASVLPKNTQD